MSSNIFSRVFRFGFQNGAYTFGSAVERVRNLSISIPMRMMRLRLRQVLDSNLGRCKGRFGDAERPFLGEGSSLSHRAVNTSLELSNCYRSFVVAK